MPTDIPQRLVAILAADIAGYTRLMELDEAGTVAGWQQACATVIDPTLARYQGRVVKRTGDGFLAEFSTVESAVEAALSMQQAFTTLFADQPAERRIAFRMGVNLGDVWVDANDIYGAGVNVAARLEALAAPGEICVSGAVYDAVKHKVRARFESMGPRTLRNVATAVHVWRVRAGEPARAAIDVPRASSNRWWIVLGGVAVLGLALAVLAYFFTNDRRPGGAPADVAVATSERADLARSVAVLPFENLSPNPNDAYFAAGMHDAVISQLSKLGQLEVISRTSVMRYADTDLSVPEIAAELGVEALLKATVRYADNRVRIAPELIDASTERLLWRSEYEGDLADVFGVQADIAMNIANALGAEFSAAELERIGRPPTVSPEAYALYLQAQDIYYSVSAASSVARDLTERALELDPNFALAHGSLAVQDAGALINSIGSSAVEAHRRAEIESEVRARAERALDLDPNVLDANAAIASIDFFHWRWTVAREGFERALELAPSDMPASGLGAWVNAWQGRREEAMRIAEQGVRLNPGVAEPFRSLGIAHAFVGELEAAAESLRAAQRIAPIDSFTSIWLASVEIGLGNDAEGARLLDLTDRVMGANRTLAVLPELAQGYARVGRSDDARRVVEEIRAVAAEREVGAGTWAMVHVAMGDHEQALEYLEIAAEKVRNHEIDEGFWALNHLRANITRNPVLERQEFQAMLTRLQGD